MADAPTFTTRPESRSNGHAATFSQRQFVLGKGGVNSAHEANHLKSSRSQPGSSGFVETGHSGESAQSESGHGGGHGETHNHETHNDNRTHTTNNTTHITIHNPAPNQPNEGEEGKEKETLGETQPKPPIELGPGAQSPVGIGAGASPGAVRAGQAQGIRQRQTGIGIEAAPSPWSAEVVDVRGNRPNAQALGTGQLGIGPGAPVGSDIADSDVLEGRVIPPVRRQAPGVDRTPPGTVRGSVIPDRPAITSGPQFKNLDLTGMGTADVQPAAVSYGRFEKSGQGTLFPAAPYKSTRKGIESERSQGRFPSLSPRLEPEPVPVKSSREVPGQQSLFGPGPYKANAKSASKPTRYFQEPGQTRSSGQFGNATPLTAPGTDLEGNDNQNVEE